MARSNFTFRCTQGQGWQGVTLLLGVHKDKDGKE